MTTYHFAAISKFIILFVFGIAAIYSRAQVRVGVIGGGNISKISIKEFNIGHESFSSSSTMELSSQEQNKSMLTYFAGLKLKFDLAPNVSVCSKIMIDKAGFVNKFHKYIAYFNGPPIGSPLISSTDVDGEDRIRLLYLTVPVHLVFYAGIKKTKIFLGTGGYVSYGLFGTNEFHVFNSSGDPIEDSIGIITFSSNSKIKYAEYHARRLDFGLSFTTGIEFRNRIFIEAGYDAGMTSVFKDRFLAYGIGPEGTLHHFDNRKRQFRIGIGFWLR